MRISGLVASGVLAVSVITTGSLAPAPGVDAQTTSISSIDCDVPPAGATATNPVLESFESTAPFRIVDTRVAFGGDGPVPEGCTLVIDMSDVGPAEASAYALSVTAIAQDVGFVTAFSCSDGRPGTSSLNPRVGIATPNLVVVAPDENREVCLFFLQGGELVVDVSGWWAEGDNRFRPIEPVRVEDTRERLPIVPADNTIVVDVGGVAVPDDARAVSINIAAVDSEGRGHLVVYPCGAPFPDSSNVNFEPNETRSVAAIVALGSDGPAAGRLCVTPSAPTHVVIDVTGYSSDTGGAAPDVVIESQSNERVVDTRDPAVAGVRFPAQTTQRFDVSGVLSRPEDAIGVLLNVVVTEADLATFVTVYPCTDEVPFIASINHGLTDTANLVVSALDDSGAFCVYSERGADVVVDLVGVITGPEDSLLNELTLRDAAGALLPLDQRFTVDGADYTIPCDSGAEVLLRLGLAPGVTATVNDVEVVSPPSAADPDRAVTIEENGRLAIGLNRGGRTDTYDIRCVPPDFPRLDLQLADPASPQPPGWYLTELGWNDNSTGYFLAIFDHRGVPVWYKRADDVLADPDVRALIDTKLLSDGLLVTSSITGTGMGVDPEHGHLVLGLDGTVVDERLSGDVDAPVDHHDYVEIPGPNNRRAIVSYPLLDGQDLTGLVLPTVPASTFFGCHPSVADTNKTIVDGTIIERDDTGEIWRWNASDLFPPAAATYAQCFRNYDVNPYPDPDDPPQELLAGEVDLYHINSIDRVLDSGCEPQCDYVVSARHLDAVFRVDRSADPMTPASLDWWMGADGVADAAKRLDVLGDPLGSPVRTHDARMSGDVLTLHDNRSGTGDTSRAVAYRIDPAAGTATWLWQVDHPEGLNNPSLGSARITDDGTVLVGWGQVDPLFSEHDLASGDELARWTRVGTSMTAYRIVKYPIDAFDVDQLRENAGGSITPLP